MFLKLFRAISIAELRSFLESGAFKSSPNSVNGKYFAETVEHAAEWGQRLYDSDDFRIIAVELSKAQADKLIRWERLDGIGPARFAELDELSNAVVTVMK